MIGLPRTKLLLIFTELWCFMAWVLVRYSVINFGHHFRSRVYWNSCLSQFCFFHNWPSVILFCFYSPVFIIAGIHASAQPWFLCRNKKGINNNDTTLFGNMVYFSILVITVVLSHQSISSAWEMIQTISSYISVSTWDEMHTSASIIVLTVVYVFSMSESSLLLLFKFCMCNLSLYRCYDFRVHTPFVN